MLHRFQLFLYTYKSNLSTKLAKLKKMAVCKQYYCTMKPQLRQVGADCILTACFQQVLLA